MEFGRLGFDSLDWFVLVAFLLFWYFEFGDWWLCVAGEGLSSFLADDR